MIRSKIFLAMAVVMALVFSAVSFAPAVALAKSFSINRNGEQVHFNASGKGGFFKEKDFSLEITNHGPDPIRIIYGFDQGIRINPNHSHVVNFTAKKNFNFKWIIQTEGKFGKATFDVNSGNLSIN